MGCRVRESCHSPEPRFGAQLARSWEYPWELLRVLWRRKKCDEETGTAIMYAHGLSMRMVVSTCENDYEFKTKSSEFPVNTGK